MSKLKQKAAEYFSRYNTKTELFGSSDGFLFEMKQDANAHASTLEDKTVTHYKNEQNTQATETKPGLLELSISKLKVELQEVDSAGLIEALIIQERGADNGGRIGAIDALEDRLKELNEQ